MKTTLIMGGVLPIVGGDLAHRVKNVHSGNGAEHATYVVAKGKRLMTLVK